MIVEHKAFIKLQKVKGQDHQPFKWLFKFFFAEKEILIPIQVSEIITIAITDVVGG